MTNQQLEVSNELHMSPLLPHTRPAPSPRSMATHIPQTPQLIVTAVLVANQPNSAPRCSTSAAINAQQLMEWTELFVFFMEIKFKRLYAVFIN